MRKNLRFGLVLTTSLCLAACTTEDTSGTSEPTTSFKVRQSVEQLAITHAEPGATVELRDSAGALVQSGEADALGSLMFRKVPPGEGYSVKVKDEEASNLKVMTEEGSKPAQSHYAAQQLDEGFGYITTRDGTTLSVFVTLPGPADAGPYPTVVNYSGYDPSRPGEAYSFCDSLGTSFPTLCHPPSDASGLLASFLGYATVSVNMRGTGCSGGAYDYFEEMQLLDGYDVIETVAAQSWALNHKVGMTGLSYPGIAQLFTAKMQPPSLAAITPLSVIGNTVTTLVPGGMLNDGFALSWVEHVLVRADPYGQGWEQARVDGGDTICEENQLLHGQKVDNVKQAEETPYYVPSEHAQYNPTDFAHQIKVPVFLAGAYQDEQTGPYFTTLFNQLSGAPNTRFMLYNGIHRDGFQPAVLSEWKAFLDIYVARKVPSIDKDVRNLGPILFEQISGAKTSFPEDRWAGVTTVEDAQKKWEAEPKVVALFDSGAGDPATLGAPVPAFQKEFTAWPPSETKALRYYLSYADAQLSLTPPATTADAYFVLDPAAGQTGNVADTGPNIDSLLPNYDWKTPAPESAIVMESAPLGGDVLMFGTASADLWVKSDADDADLEVTISEVRPDNKETYVQSGVLRASFRTLGDDSTELDPSPTWLKDDLAPLPAGEWSLVRVPIPAFGHAFRSGSRVRVIIDTPGGTRPSWRFRLNTFPGQVTNTISMSAEHPSSVVFPVIEGATVPSALPPCPSLRGQACRDYVSYENVALQ